MVWDFRIDARRPVSGTSMRSTVRTPERDPGGRDRSRPGGSRQLLRRSECAARPRRRRSRSRRPGRPAPAWIGPDDTSPLNNLPQLLRDDTPMPVGFGAIFAPSLSDGDREPLVSVYQNGRLVQGKGRLGRRIVVRTGRLRDPRRLRDRQPAAVGQGPRGGRQDDGRATHLGGARRGGGGRDLRPVPRHLRDHPHGEPRGLRARLRRRRAARRGHPRLGAAARPLQDHPRRRHLSRPHRLRHGQAGGRPLDPLHPGAGSDRRALPGRRRGRSRSAPTHGGRAPT